MTDFAACVASHVEAGDLSKDDGAALQEAYEGIRAELEDEFGPEAAAAAAGERVVREREAEQAAARRRKLMQVLRIQNLERDLQAYRGKDGKPDLGQALTALIENDGFSKYSSVAGKYQAIRGKMHGRMVEVLNTFRRDYLTRTRNKASLDAMGRELFGEQTGDKTAAELARAVESAREYGRKRFNMAGGSVPERNNYGLPMEWDVLKVRRMTSDEFYEAVIPHLDKKRMLSEQTGQPMTEKQLRLTINEAWEVIRTDGAVNMTPSTNPRGRALASRRADHRFFVFKNYDGWKAVNARLGQGNAFNAVMAHLDGYARDVAQMEVLGPNPAATMTYLSQLVRKNAKLADGRAGGSKAENRATGRIALANAMYAHFTGSTNAPERGRIATVFGGAREFFTSSYLGAATLSAIGDLELGRKARAFAGLPQVRTIQGVVKQFVPGNRADQKAAIRMGLVADHWSSLSIAARRYMDTSASPDVMRRVSDVILRSSFLSQWTQAGRWAFGMEFAGFMADEAGKRYSQLNPAFRRTLNRHGFDAGDWDRIRTVPLYEHKGAKFLRAEDIEGHPDMGAADARALSDRVLEMVLEETEYAVPSSRLRGRAMLIGETRPGSFSGEIMRSAAMFKSFGITVLLQHTGRMVQASSPIAYASSLVLAMTAMGALSIQLKELAKGKDPRSMAGDAEQTSAFWLAALLQGGGLGIFGDFLFAEQNRFGQGLEQTLAGPVAGFLGDTLALTVGNAVQGVKGEKTNFPRELTEYLSRQHPGASLWYARLLMQRMVWDQLRDATDPAAAKRRRAHIRRLAKEGQSYWWRPGESGPDRAPDFPGAINQ